ncbi:hypothetical protein FHY55_12415 [Oceanicola sp. D3]|uniref:hypothetical protein n=1 Tax=Oceanicola sp. D3 TaxID=2587163 RepID=UPI001121440D|nr:hypothetical protein [Oceanicola sp. D3]QDC09998.1 hypothetical protein FHY55_12415 [Oceanicola sp. D3]
MINYVDDIAITTVLTVISLTGLWLAMGRLGSDHPRLVVACFGFALVVPSIVILTMYGHIPKESSYALFGTLVGFVGGLFAETSKVSGVSETSKKAAESEGSN